MKKLAEKYQSWSEIGKNLFLLVCVAIAGALISLVWVFLDNIGVLLGWLLGSAVNIFAYFTMAKGASYLLGESRSTKAGYLVIVWGVLRFGLYAGTLVLACFCSFKWGSLSHGYCNLISAALGLMPTWITLACSMLLRNRKQAAPAPKKEEPVAEEKEEEVGDEQ